MYKSEKPDVAQDLGQCLDRKSHLPKSGCDWALYVCAIRSLDPEDCSDEVSENDSHPMAELEAIELTLVCIANYEICDQIGGAVAAGS